MPALFKTQVSGCLNRLVGRYTKVLKLFKLFETTGDDYLSDFTQVMAMK